MHTSAPVQERIYTIDIVRGLAVFGIFLVNWPSLVGIEIVGGQTVYDGANALIRLLYDLFIQTKFYTIFSFLFGLGFYIFMKRAEEKGMQARPLFLRRLLLLLFFGSLHYILLWSGDILHSYAIAGLFLLLFYRRSAKSVLITGIILLSLFTLLMFAAYSWLSLQNTVSEIANTAPLSQWGQQVPKRWNTFTGENLASNVMLLPETVGLFLLGLYAGKIDLFRRVQELDRRLWMLQLSSFLLALPCWYQIIRHYQSADAYNATGVFPFVLLSGKFLFIFYVVSLLRITQQKRWLKWLRPFGFVGQMALTNYIAQTIGTLLLFSMWSTLGFSLSLAVGLVFCPMFYALQIWWSRLWLSRFQYGPLEYVWRVGTYGKMFPIRRQSKTTG